MIYDITHVTHYSYQNTAVFSQHLMRLSPRALSGQQVLQSQIKLVPEADSLVTNIDMFGNISHVATVSRPHRSIEIRATSRVERAAPSSIIFEASGAWEEVRKLALGHAGAPVPVEVGPFCFPSLMTEGNADIEAYARESFTAGRPILAAAKELTERIYTDFEYLPGTTSAETLPVVSFAEKRGVCQDFAHVMLACLRSLRLPARYVSGYLRTHTADGATRLQGADASHAWISLWDPVFGWIDFDPTNNLVPGLDHVTLAWARDYADVAPVSGIVIGAGHQILSVGVDVDLVCESGATQAQGTAATVAAGAKWV
ncbi:transglutaminase family protein [Rhodobacteraceae bacterium NNCM2]|nr:transglutaminase family protein [Coraliihabitans acroporae]